MIKSILKYCKRRKRHLKKGWSIFFSALLTVVVTTLLVNWLWPQGAYTEPDLPVYEYGVAETIINDSGNLHVYLTYPSLGIEQIDKVISDWAQGIYDQAQKEFLALGKKDPLAELEVNSRYNSYLLDGRFVSVENYISYNIPSQASTQEDAKAFNIDLQNKKFLQFEEIFDKSKEEEILRLLKQKILDQYPLLESHIGRMDFRWLENMVLTWEGAIFILAKGQFLPAYVGTNNYILTYQELKDAFILLDKPLPLPEPEIISQEPQPQPPSEFKIDPNKPMIALTFDDGPSIYTKTILDVLAGNEARATFFILGTRAESYGSVIRQAVEQGSEVASHSWIHKNLTKLSKEEIKQDLEKTAQVIYDISGVKTVMYRPPYGAINDNLKTVSKNLQLSLIMWSVDTQDWKKKDAEAVYKYVINNAKDGSIILCHDIYESTAAAMKRIIPFLIEKGYQLVTVSELLDNLEPGQVYRGILKQEDSPELQGDTEGT